MNEIIQYQLYNGYNVNIYATCLNRKEAFLCVSKHDCRNDYLSMIDLISYDLIRENKKQFTARINMIKPL